MRKANFSSHYAHLPCKILCEMNKSLCALSRPIQPRQKSVSLRVVFCDDAADEHKNGHACHSLIRSNSRTSVDAAKKKASCRYHLARGIIATIIIDNFAQNRANYRVHLCKSPRRFDIFHQIFLLQSVISIEPSSRKFLMKVKHDMELYAGQRIFVDKNLNMWKHIQERCTVSPNKSLC